MNICDKHRAVIIGSIVRSFFRNPSGPGALPIFKVATTMLIMRLACGYLVDRRLLFCVEDSHGLVSRRMVALSQSYHDGKTYALVCGFET